MTNPNTLKVSNSLPNTVKTAQVRQALIIQQHMAELIEDMMNMFDSRLMLFKASFGILKSKRSHFMDYSPYEE